MLKKLIVLTLSILPLSQLHAEHTEFATFKGAYMGQQTPGLNAEPFAPGIISTQGWELEGVFAHGMKEFYYTNDLAQGNKDKKFSPTVIGYKRENNKWRKFTQFPRSGEIVFSEDGNTMYMAKKYRERTTEGWSELKSLGPLIDKKEYGIMRLSASTQGSYVFDDYKNNDLIRISKLVNGQRQAPEVMGKQINAGKWTAHPLIAPDESYIIWDSEREGGFGKSDLYISFKQADGDWGKAINMGPEVNSAESDFYASVTPDGKYLIFNRTIDSEKRNIDIYWSSAKIIEKLKAQHSITIKNSAE